MANADLKSMAAIIAAGVIQTTAGTDESIARKSLDIAREIERLAEAGEQPATAEAAAAPAV